MAKVISIDTNLVVRFLLQDNDAEFAIASRVIREEEIYITTTVMLECEWVLRRVYKHSSASIMDAFDQLRGLANVRLAEPDIVERAIGWRRSGLDFADALHLALASKADSLGTFDPDFVKSAARVSPHIPVRSPA